MVTHPAKNKIWCCGRRFGKGQAIIYDIQLSINKQYQSNMTGTTLAPSIGYYAPTYSQAEEIMWERLCHALHPLIDYKRHKKLIFKFKNGARLKLYGLDMAPDKLRGTYKTKCIVDEAAFCQLELYHAAVTPQLADVNGDQLLVSTPNGQNEFWKLFKRANNSTSGLWKTWQYPSIAGGYVSEDYINEQKANLDEDHWRQEYLAEFILTHNSVYYNFDMDKHVMHIDYQPDKTIHWGWDFNINPSVHSVLAHEQDGKLYVFDEICVGDTPATTARFIEQYPPQRDTQIVLYGDYNGKVATSGYSDYMIITNMLQNAGYNVVERVKVNPYERDRTNNINTLLRNANGIVSLVMDHRCKRLIKDLQEVKNKNGKIDKTSNPYLTHASDALGYLAYMLLPPRFTPLQGRQTPEKPVLYDNMGKRTGWWT